MTPSEHIPDFDDGALADSESLDDTADDPAPPDSRLEPGKPPLVSEALNPFVDSEDAPAAPLIDIPASAGDTAEPADATIATPVETTAAGDGLPHGPGHRADLFWQPQSENGFCVPMSVATILTEFTGSVHTETEVVSAAVAGGWLEGEPGAWKGMDTAGAVALIEHYGIDAHTEVGTVAQLESYLDEGRAVILAIDSSEVWESRDDDGSAADEGADHAVRITAIDEARGVAILQDPGDPDGQGAEVPLQTLEDAWRDSNNQMVVTDAGTPDSGAMASPPEGASEPSPAVARPTIDQEREPTGVITGEAGLIEHGAVILPVALSLIGGTWTVVRRQRRQT